MYDIASSILPQNLPGQRRRPGRSSAAARCRRSGSMPIPRRSTTMGFGLEDLRTALNSANANRPKGALANRPTTLDDRRHRQLLKAEQYRPLIITYRNGAPVRVGDVATVNDSVEDIRTGGLANGKPAVLLMIFRQPGANIIDTVDRVRDVTAAAARCDSAGQSIFR